jgi:hypothetical protein
MFQHIIGRCGRSIVSHCRAQSSSHSYGNRLIGDEKWQKTAKPMENGTLM